MLMVEYWDQLLVYRLGAEMGSPLVLQLVVLWEVCLGDQIEEAKMDSLLVVCLELQWEAHLGDLTVVAMLEVWLVILLDSWWVF